MPGDVQIAGIGMTLGDLDRRWFRQGAPLAPHPGCAIVGIVMRTLAWCLALVLPACFDNAPEVETLGGDGGGSSTVGEASTSGSDTATAESSDTGGVSSSLGTVSLRSARVPADSVANLSASFGSGLDDCSSEGQAVGPCSISACGVDMVQRPDAGTIGFDRNGAVQAPQLEPGALGHYMPVQLSMAPFLPGDEVGVHASGGEVPGFDVLVSAPPGVKFDQNAVDLVLNASSPLTVTWVPPPPDAAGEPPAAQGQRHSPGADQAVAPGAHHPALAQCLHLEPLDDELAARGGDADRKLHPPRIVREGEAGDVACGPMLAAQAYELMDRAEIVPADLRWLVQLNPMSMLVDLFRELLYSGHVPALGSWLSLAGIALLALGAGWALFAWKADECVYYV